MTNLALVQLGPYLPSSALAAIDLPEDVFDVDALAKAFQSLPVEGLIPAGVALAMGLLLWWFGERLLRLAMMVVAVFVGVPMGLMLGAALAPTLPPLAAAIVGAVVMLIAAAVGLKFAVAGGLALVVGLASLLGAIVAVEQGWVDLGVPMVRATDLAPARVAPAGSWSGFDSGGVELTALGAASAPAFDLPDAAEEVVASAWSDLLDSLLLARDWAGARWSNLPPAGRTLAGTSGAVGLVVGFGLGLIFQRLALRLATAVFGSLLIVSGGTTLLGWLAPEWVARSLPGGPWLGLWGVLSVVGAFVQWKRSGADADEE